MIAWVVRVAVRRVVWLVVGVAVVAALSVVGVRAGVTGHEDAPVTTTTSGQHYIGASFEVDPGTGVTWSVRTTSPVGGANIVYYVGCAAAADQVGGSFLLDSGLVPTGTYRTYSGAFVAGTGICVGKPWYWLQAWFQGGTGTGTVGYSAWWDDGVPAATVELSSADRERLDGLSTGLALLVFLGTASVVAVGLRR